MKNDISLPLSRLGGYLAQLEQQYAPSAYIKPFQEALDALANLRALQEGAQASRFGAVFGERTGTK